MHPYAIPDFIKDRVIRRQGKLLSHDVIDAARAALIVVDMQNYFVAEGFPLEVPIARAIVPNINRLARALRKRERILRRPAQPGGVFENRAA